MDKIKTETIALSVLDTLPPSINVDEIAQNAGTVMFRVIANHLREQGSGTIYHDFSSTTEVDLHRVFRLFVQAVAACAPDLQEYAADRVWRTQLMDAMCPENFEDLEGVWWIEDYVGGMGASIGRLYATSRELLIATVGEQWGATEDEWFSSVVAQMEHVPDPRPKQREYRVHLSVTIPATTQLTPDRVGEIVEGAAQATDTGGDRIPGWRVGTTVVEEVDAAAETEGSVVR